MKTVLVIDWPDREVPETLARAGLQVVVRGGPGPDEFSSYELHQGKLVISRIGQPPKKVDLVYAFRPLSELPEIIGLARALQARAVWTQSGLSAAGVKHRKGCWLPAAELAATEDMVQSAGLLYLSQPYIADAAREILLSQ